MAGKVFFSVTRRLDGFIAVEPLGELMEQRQRIRPRRIPRRA